nr:hypothetical protein L321_02272 [Pseudomonas plecoglossicida NB2011]
MQGDLVRREMTDLRKHMDFEGTQDLVMAFLVAFAIGRVPLSKQRFHGVGFQDGLFFELPHNSWVMPLLQLRTQPLSFRARVFEGHQRICAEIKTAGTSVIAKAQLKGNLALRRHPHTKTIAVGFLFSCIAGLAALGFQPGV